MNRVSKLSLIVITYAVLISAWYTSWLVVGDSNWWLTLLNRITLYLFIPVPIFLAYAILARRYKPIALLVLPFLIFVRLYHPYLFPKLENPIEDSTDLSVMTYNVLYSNSDYDAVANVVLAYHPDLVSLQEVQPAMMTALKEQLADNYPYSLMGTENDYGSTAVFSRYPLIDSYILDLKADRPAVVVKTRIDDREIRFVAVHLLAYTLWWTKLKDIPAVVIQRTISQNRQVEILLEQIKKEDGIVVVGCDCNSYETSSSYRIFEQSMSNTSRKVGWSLGRNELSGVKQDTLLQHIDYVWYRGSLNPIRTYRIKDSGGSDHLPVLAIFQFN